MSLDLADNAADGALVASTLGCASIEATAPDTITVADEARSAGKGLTYDQGSERGLATGDGILLGVGSDLRSVDLEQSEATDRLLMANLASLTPVQSRETNWLAQLSISAPIEAVAFDFGPGDLLIRHDMVLSIPNLSPIASGEQPAFRDQRHTNAQAPAWYLFVGADNQALLWNGADRESLSGVALRNQLTIGDLQVGFAWSTGFGGHTAFGMVERKFKFNDITGDHDVSSHERFAAISYSLEV